VPPAGFPFLFGFYGSKASSDTVSLLKSTGACGVLLLPRNIETPAQTKALCAELTQRVGRELLFSIDHEGGWVLRFTNGITFFPGNAALGAAKDSKLAYQTGAHMARELAALGIQLNLAPVLDVLTPRYNPGIGIRSFGADPKLVGKLGAAFARGSQDHGVWACAKHFPGKGAAAVDAHVQLPTIKLPKAAFTRTHVAPFKAAIEAGVSCVMTSHVRYPALDSKIATFSKKITKNILRDGLGFEGVVISDDLCMGAVSTNQPIQTAAAEALHAGHDLLIVAHDTEVMRESAELVEGALGSGELDREVFEASCRRVARLIEPPAPRKPAGSAMKLAASVSERAVEVLRRGTTKLPVRGKPLVLFPDFREVRERFAMEGGPEGPKRWLEKRIRAKVALTPIESADVSRLAAAVESAESVVFFCFEAMRFPGQRAVLELVNEKAPGKTVAALIRGHWDAELLDRRITALHSRGYRLRQLEAILGRIGR
jgi:beta-N-acetylhexosaminidase